MELQTARLLLTPCTEKSLVTYTTKGYELGPHIQTYVEKLNKDPSLFGWGVWLVVHKQTKKIIGDIGFKGKPDKAKSVEIGYGIAASEQNKGYATEAASCLIDWAFDSCMVHNITAECLADNIPSIHVLEKVRMKNIHTDNGMLYWKLEKQFND